MLLITPILFGLFVIATLGMGLVVLPFVGLIAVIDAYLLDKKLKEGQAIGDWEFFGIESATSLAMPNLVSNVAGGKPDVAVKPRPPGLVGSAIGMSPSASKPATSERPKTSQGFGDFWNAAG